MIHRRKQTDKQGAFKKQQRTRSKQMWDELIGIAVFVGLFVGGLIIFHVVEQWRERKRSRQK
jgi:hypothetical protein